MGAEPASPARYAHPPQPQQPTASSSVAPGPGPAAAAAAAAAAADVDPAAAAPTAEMLSRTYSLQSRRSRNERRASLTSVDYDTPDVYRNLDDAYALPPIQDPEEGAVGHLSTLEDNRDLEAQQQQQQQQQSPQRRSSLIRRSGAGGGGGGAAARRMSQSSHWSQSSSARAERMARRRSSVTPVEYDVPDEYANLGETMDVSPVQNPDEDPIYRHENLEQVRSREQDYMREQQRLRRRESLLGEKRPEIVQGAAGGAGEEKKQPRRHKVSRLVTQIYTLSYLVFFSLLGTLARLGLQALTTYQGAPIIFPSLWPNFSGSLIMGFLAEDRMLFRFEWGIPTYENQLNQARQRNGQNGQNGGAANANSNAIASGSDSTPPRDDDMLPAVDLAAAKKAYAATKKTIPMYIGLATGFCGSFTSFSSFIRDVFLALSNDLTAPGADVTVPRNGGYSFMALVAVMLVTISASLAGLFIGAHLAIALEPITPSLPYMFTRKILDRLAVLLGWGCWIGAVMLCIWPPFDRWRGDATFALAFAPLGCLARFYASLYLNGRVASFPLGTFTVNVVGTAVLAMAWDLAHVPLGGVIGCQVLQGVEDGFCGCLTTVSTWVTELAALRRRHAYVYGGASVGVALAVMVAVMGGLRWSDGFAGLLCTH